MLCTRRAALVVATALAAGLACAASPAHAADANASAVAVEPADGDVFVGGSATFANDLRSGVAGRWDPAHKRFDWLERVDAAPGASDWLTAVVRAREYLYGIGYANGQLAVAKMDAATGTLRRACGPSGIRLTSLGPAVMPGRAVASGTNVIVVGTTLVKPTRGFVAEVSGDDCRVVRSALLGSGDRSVDIGFTAVDVDANGDPVVSGFSGTKAVVFRFDSGLAPRASRTFDLGGGPGTPFTDVRAGTDGGVAVARIGSKLLGQCFTLPAVTADEHCGTDGRRTLEFDSDGAPAGGATLARLASGDWLVAGAQLGEAQARPALTALHSDDLTPDTDQFAPTGTKVFDAFTELPASFAAVAASPAEIAGAGTSGFVGSRQPFLLTSALDGADATVTPLPFAAAPAARVEPAPPPAIPQPAPPAPAPAAPRPPATIRFARLSRRPAADGTFGSVTLWCRRACSARGTYTAPLRRRHSVRLGGTTAHIAAGWRVRLRLAVTRKGMRMLVRARRLPVKVRIAVVDSAGDRLVARRTVRLRGRRGHDTSAARPPGQRQLSLRPVTRRAAAP